jgi:hypothetical protein
LKNEEEVSGINSGMADFLQDMSFAPEHSVFVCVNVGERMRGTQPIAGELWAQEGRQMTATAELVEGLDSSRESVALSGVYNALVWRHAMETSMDPNYKRRGQRVIVYPRFLDKFGIILASGNVGFDIKGNRDIVYENGLQEKETWLEFPVFMPEDGLCLTIYPVLVQPVQEWMEDTKRIAVAGDCQVLVDGPDVCDSESEAEYSDHGKVLEGMYRAE